MLIRSKGLVTLSLTVVMLSVIIALTFHARYITEQHLQTLLALESAEQAYWAAQHQQQRSLGLGANGELP